MNEPIDDKYEDAQISALYQKASAEQPPSHVDAAILAAAKREAHAKPRSLSPFGAKWTLPFSLAAVVVLSVSIVTLVQKESSMEIANTADQLSGVAEAPAARQEEEIAVLKRRAAAPRAEPELSAGITPKVTEASRENPESRERLPESPALMLRAPAGIDLGAANSGLSSPATRDETTADSAPQSSAAEALADTQNISAPSKAEHLAKPIVEEKETTVAEAATSETSVSTATIEETDQRGQQPSRQALALRAKPTAPQEQPQAPSREPTQEPTQEPSQPALAQTQPMASDINSSQQVAIPATAAAVRPSRLASCDSLSARDCLQSPQCTYVLSDENSDLYICRDATNRCEQGFNQLRDTKQNCESKPGCRFIPGHCECPAAMPCDCRSKNPPQCVKQ